MHDGLGHDTNHEVPHGLVDNGHVRVLQVLGGFHLLLQQVHGVHEAVRTILVSLAVRSWRTQGHQGGQAMQPGSRNPQDLSPSKGTWNTEAQREATGLNMHRASHTLLTVSEPGASAEAHAPLQQDGEAPRGGLAGQGEGGERGAPGGTKGNLPGRGPGCPAPFSRNWPSPVPDCARHGWEETEGASSGSSHWAGLGATGPFRSPSPLPEVGARGGRSPVAGALSGPMVARSQPACSRDRDRNGTTEEVTSEEEEEEDTAER
ncbi:uncharacterized protein LOC144329757 [Macaca mulatta]